MAARMSCRDMVRSSVMHLRAAGCRLQAAGCRLQASWLRAGLGAEAVGRSASYRRARSGGEQCRVGRCDPIGIRGSTGPWSVAMREFAPRKLVVQGAREIVSALPTGNLSVRSGEAWFDLQTRDWRVDTPSRVEWKGWCTSCFPVQVHRC